MKLQFDFPRATALISITPMKTLLSLVIVSILGATALADIQDPPGNDYGPTRKLGRGLANILYGASDLIQTPTAMNEHEGNAAGWSYGPVKGIGHFFLRLGMGVYEVVTFPFPTYRGSYRPPYKLSVPWINGGIEEFPPELGFESRYRYTKNYDGGT
jgi:putative exosortase-associated protein (TIGR04073 family)